MTFNQLVAFEKDRLLTEKRALERNVYNAPSGTLTFCKNISKGKPYYKWYVRDNKNHRRYLKRKEHELAKILATKTLTQARLKDINSELKALDAYLDKHCESSFLRKLMVSPGYGELVNSGKIQTPPTLAEKFQIWGNEEYEINPKNPEERNVQTPQGIKVRSKSEALILMLLDVHHIPFRYECRLDVGYEHYYPDFTIRHPTNGKIYYWEHCGRMDKPDYRSDYLNKMRNYINYGVIPDHNLILTYESDGHPLNMEIAQDKIEEFFLRSDDDISFEHHKLHVTPIF